MTTVVANNPKPHRDRSVYNKQYSIANYEKISLRHAIYRYNKLGITPTPTSKLVYYCKLNGLDVEKVLKEGLPN